ncbi:PQQ-like beta-propeller repeat protein [Stieleria sp. JC731]|uniref:PQQ-binding-like beta-propeller repeat protein n=1 Tax=Pirellulaceae TaxID=2691357 RepID=UPI001E2F0047|nr:PQQ-binding-like beta-propeller repeat protein [Stieleria sp. JC731]MCC9603003.1 PQQ-like beta-propeller repeat protein [Stieleria sp. JC731]
MRLLPAIALLLILPSITFAADLTQGWPQWRGPEFSGVAENSNPPTTWSESENIRWKIEVPGAGSSTPIILGDRVYVATAIETDRSKEGAPAEEAQADTSNDQGEQERGRRRGGRRGFGGGPSPTKYYQFAVVAYDRANGTEVWRSVLTEQVPHEAGHNTNTFASSSPLTDGDRLYVSFGSRGVFAIDFEGKKLWEKNLGTMQTRAQFGEGSSPALANGTLVVPFDHEGESFIVALNAKTGDEQWRQKRDEPTTWATPLITEYNGAYQVITNGTNKVRSYDLASGEIVWECGGQAQNPIPSPVRYKDDVIVMTGYRGYAIYSIPLSSKGDVTDSDNITWIGEDAAPYVPSPLLYKGQLYFVKSNNGIIVSRDAATGDVIIDETRLDGIRSIYASPVAANDHIYITGRDGETVVIRHGKSLEVVASNKLAAEIDASAAIVGDEIYLRGKHHLYCIAK